MSPPQWISFFAPIVLSFPLRTVMDSLPFPCGSSLKTWKLIPPPTCPFFALQPSGTVSDAILILYFPFFPLRRIFPRVASFSPGSIYHLKDFFSILCLGIPWASRNPCWFIASFYFLTLRSPFFPFDIVFCSIFFFFLPFSPSRGFSVTSQPGLYCEFHFFFLYIGWGPHFPRIRATVFSPPHLFQLLDLHPD